MANHAAISTSSGCFPQRSACSNTVDSPISSKVLDRDFDCQDRADWLTPKRLDALGCNIGALHRSQRPQPCRGPARPDSPHHRGATGEHARRTRRHHLGHARSVHHARGSSPRSIPCPSESAAHTGHARTARCAYPHLLTSLIPAREPFRTPRRLLAEIGATAAPDSPPPEHYQPGRRGALDRATPEGSARSASRWLRQTTTPRRLPLRQRFPSHANPWARPTSSTCARARIHDHPHATRILARPRLYVIRHCSPDQHRLRPAATHASSPKPS